MGAIGRPLAWVVVCALFAVPAGAGAAGSSERSSAKSRGSASSKLHVVRMIDEPVVAYRGGVPGLQATRPARGAKIDPLDPRVVAYVRFLDARHDAALRTVGGSKVYDYRYTFNGFAAELTPAAAEALRSAPGVLSVEKDELVSADTSSTPTFLGLDVPGSGLWSRLGGPASAGEGIIIGVIDTGIWPDHPSFSDRAGFRTTGPLTYLHIPGWHGRCVPGEAFTAADCGQKLVGAQYFNAAWGGSAAIKALLPWEFTSPRDHNGHGTHTASTAGGNRGVWPTGPASIFGPISGMAPRARIAAYKALWTQPDGTGSGFTSDLVAAIDQAVADGVDVINYSISGSRTNFRDPAEIAFLYAAAAGIFVSTSAGNSGPTTATVAHPGPWVTTVAAGTHNRNGEGSVTLGNAATYTGASLAAAAVGAPLVDAATAALPGADPALAQLCYAAVDNGGVPVLDPAKVAGKIVLCDRGVTARVNKSLAVGEAGGVGMILVNVSASSLNADFHSVPSVHLSHTDRPAMKAYAATAGATATIARATIVYDTPAPFTASFSSRGPLRASGDLLKPDLIAPGQDILAAVAPPGNAGKLFDLYSGTSMSAPHVAGLAALLKQLRPGWTPAMIKSALMTTAGNVLDGPSTHPLVIFRQGAGQVAPNRAADPGLVFDAGWNDWLGFLCGTQLPAAFCTARGIPVLDPSDFNGASIAIGDLAGSQTVTRRVTNVGPTATYGFSKAGLAGFDLSVSPASFTLGTGESQVLTLTFSRTAAAFNAFAGGQLTWSDGAHAVRVPVVVRPVALAAPEEVSGSYPIQFGYTGPFTATPRGLVPAATVDGQVSTDPAGSFKPGGPGTTGFEVTIPAGTTYARFALFDASTTPGSDLDLYVYKGSTQVGASGGPTANEQVSLENPAAGTYTVWVHGFATANPSRFTLFTWLLDGVDRGNMTVAAPASASLGAAGRIDLGFTGLTPGVKYLGSVAYGGVAGLPSPTIVRVDP